MGLGTTVVIEMKGDVKMLARVIGAAAALAVVAIVVSTLPDLARYLKIHQM